MDALLKTKNHTDISSVFIEDSLLKLFPENFCLQHNIIPISFDGSSLTVVCENEDWSIIDEIQSYVNFDKIQFNICDTDSIRKHIKKFYKKFEFSFNDISVYGSDIGEYICDKILLDAFSKKASDIHFCPNKKVVSVKYRVDGILEEVCDFPKEKWSHVCVRIKVLSELDISETRIPQDGSFEKEISGKKIDFRVSCHPTIHGENVVLRVLGNSKPMDIDSLNYSEHIMEDLKKFISMPEGLVIFTGPVGSGKTTSLYSLLSCLDPYQNNIVTLEDPIECSLSNIRQTDVNKSPNMNFANGIKSLLRQDPNVMLIGEIRDQDTAHMVMRAAMTGHKVFTTMHANNAMGVMDRLMEFGIHKSLILQYLKGVVSQRLVRKLCKCKKASYDNLPDKAKKHVGNSCVFKSVGCELCNQSGFLGRIVIAESCCFKRQVTNQDSSFLPEDFKNMRYDAMMKIRMGITSYEEISRHLDVSHDL